MAICSKCGFHFQADDAGGQSPCPKCQATTRRSEVSAFDAVPHSDHLVLELCHDDQSVAFRESERNGCATSADEENGEIKTALVGTSRQGEADTLTVCNNLVTKLGKPWGEPVIWKEQNSDIDCVSMNTTDERDSLFIQVVRAIVDENWWHLLANSGSNTMSGTADEFANALLCAIRKKADRTPVQQRANLVLAIDASRLAGLSQDSVITRVREKYGTTLSEMGFRQIWLVGPTISRTHQLT